MRSYLVESSDPLGAGLDPLQHDFCRYWRDTLQTAELACQRPFEIAMSDAYTLHRMEPLNRQRDGSCVVDITVGSDKAT